MLRYADVDFRDKSKWECNNRISPLLKHTYDGADVHPLEVGGGIQPGGKGREREGVL